MDNILIRDLDIAETASHGIFLSEINGALIESTSIHDLTICTNNSTCEFSIFYPERSVPNTAISLFSATDVTIRDVAIRDVTYGIFANAAFEDDDNWKSYAPNPTSGLTIENVSITNTRREAIQFVGVEDASIRNLRIDNSMAERTMDLMVMMSSTGITMDGLTLIGGVNALQFIGPSSFANPASDIQVSNVVIDGPSRSGIMFNMGASDISFSNVVIRNAEEHGVYLYGPSMSFFLPTENISFDNVVVESSGLEAVHLSGILGNISGNIEVGQSAGDCVAAAGGPYNSTELTQTGGSSFAVAGTVITPGVLSANCR
ncbi:MAG: hypothetical protein ABS35_19430 [Kaistia sp. SCN 65-12]|nr:MAG: hypothetical protein ABS35_19430 [Kaistia sp. SCN 65-12]